jgi:xanthine/uracil/vitamin C permease (AzgA family)
MKKINHNVFFLNALRTSLIFIAGFLSYEILKIIEYEWNKLHPGHEIFHLSKKKIYLFLIIFIVDLIILYSIVLFFNVHL